jgi:hypothetical protein
MEFEDGSSLTISGDGKAVLVQSFYKTNGVLYTVVRIVDADDARIEVEVTPGSQFEVVTPAAIAGVRGTRFTLCVRKDDEGNDATTVRVHAGIVWLAGGGDGRARSAAVDLRAGAVARRVRRAAVRLRRKAARKWREKGRKQGITLDDVLRRRR